MSGITSKTNSLGQTQTWWSDCQIEAALCLWEYATTEDRTEDRGVFEWLAAGEGAASARQQCIALAKDCDRSYHIANDLGYDDLFDWEFVPRWVREAMRITEKHDLAPEWVDYIGRKIYDEFRLEHESMRR